MENPKSTETRGPASSARPANTIQLCNVDIRYKSCVELPDFRFIKKHFSRLIFNNFHVVARADLLDGIVSLFQGLLFLVLKEVCTILIAHFFVHVGHDLGREFEAVDDFILPLVDQHSVLE